MRTWSTLQFKILNATWIIRDKAAWSSKVCHVNRQDDQRGLFSLRSYNSVFHFRIKCVMKKVCWTTADTSRLLHSWNSLWAEKKLWDCEVEEAGLGKMEKISYPDFFHDKMMISILSWFLGFSCPFKLFYKLCQLQGHSFAYKHMVVLYLVPGSSKWFHFDLFIYSFHAE